MNHRIGWRVFISQFAILVCCMLVACKTEVNQKPQPLDLAGEPLILAVPEFSGIDQLPAAMELSPRQKQVLGLRRAFFSGNFARLDAELLQLHESFMARQNDGYVVGRFLASFDETKLAGVDACNQWLKVMPDSFAAHWVCGEMWAKAAWQARSSKFLNEVSEIRLALMRERFVRANQLLVKATAMHPKPLQALVTLADNHYTSGDREAAEAFLLQAEALMSDYLPIHTKRMTYRQTKWGGSEQLFMEAYERAKAAGLSEDSMQILEEHYFDQAAKSSSPGVARQYWEDKIKQKATRRRLIELMDHHFWTSNWNAALPIATRLVQEYPDEVKGHNKRAQIHEKLGLMAEARQDYLNAAALGDDLGIQELIMANLRGGLGITERSFDRVYELCRYGAYLGSPSALNCVGSLYHEGGRPGIPFKPDPGQSLAWHLLAARAGHYNSQHDFGWLLFSGRGGGIDPTLAKRHGVFWLRRAAEQNHHYAQLRLDENRISREESIGDSGSAWQDYFYMIASMISRVLTGGWL